MLKANESMPPVDKMRDVARDPATAFRAFERMRDGVEHDWGRVLVWDPPHRFVMTWHPGHATPAAQELEVVFTGIAGGRTRLHLVHAAGNGSARRRRTRGHVTSRAGARCSTASRRRSHEMVSDSRRAAHRGCDGVAVRHGGVTFRHAAPPGDRVIHSPRVHDTARAQHAPRRAQCLDGLQWISIH